MNEVSYIIGSEKICRNPLSTCDAVVCDFLGALSGKLMHAQDAKLYPDIVTFAFWCRKSNIIKIARTNTGIYKRVGRGLAFHVTPANVPVNFAYSFAFSLLAGNANIVRVPSRHFPQIGIISDAIQTLMQDYPQIAKRTAFIDYPSDSIATAEYSKTADIRMIWGGDSTIKKLKALETPPRCIDIVFADRYSFCVLDGNAITSVNEEQLYQLANGFYNDTYLMDQNACSSPHMVLWLNDSMNARKRFWDAVAAIVDKKYNLQAGAQMDKYVKLCKEVIRLPELKSVDIKNNFIYRVELSTLPNNLTELYGTCGYFYEYAAKSLREMIPIITEKYQTLTYFGPDPLELQSFVTENHLRGIDRSVPVGNAMDIGVIWDGYDLIAMLSRIVEAK